LNKLGWQLVRRGSIPPPAYGLDAFFPLLKSLGFAPKHIVDVGANHGKWTRKAQGFFPDAHYTMVEPQDDLKRYVQDMMDAGCKLHWINAGAGDKMGNLMFTIAPRDDSSSFIPSPDNAEAANHRQVPVAVRTLNDIVASSGLPVPEMVKIDAEGFDIKVLAGASDLFGIFHCFSGTYEQALQAISYNMKLGIGGVVTFKNGKIDQFINQIDLKHLVLETDSPYLAPIPFRGKRNESSYIVNVVDKLAALYGLSSEEIAIQTTENSKAVFGI
jgi:FkbM family methyltransferase